MATLQERVTELEKVVKMLTNKILNGNGDSKRVFVRKISKAEGDAIRKRLRGKSNSRRENEISQILAENPWMTDTQVRSAGSWERGDLKGQLSKNRK